MARTQGALNSSAIGGDRGHGQATVRSRPSGGETSGGPHYLALSSTSTRRQRLVLLSGRLSMRRTVSPTWASLLSSCACSVDEVRTTLPYLRCARWLSMRTVIVLSARSETTTPWRSLGLPVPLGMGGVGSAAAAGWPLRRSRDRARHDRRSAALRLRRSVRSWARS